MGRVSLIVHIPFDPVAQRIGEVDTSRGVALHCMVADRPIRQGVRSPCSAL